MGLNTFNCPNAAPVQFRKKYYGIFDQDTLSKSPGANVGYFKFDTPIPHYEREVNIDFVYLRGNGNNQITIQLDGITKSQFGIDKNQFQVTKLCDNQYNLFNMLAYKEFEQYLKYRQKYAMNGNQIIIRVSETDYWSNFRALLTSSIQVNINTCHPSCLTCTDSKENSCITCTSQATLKNGKCTCNSAFLFQDGQCVPTCDQTKQYFKKQEKDIICTYIKNCLSWDITNQKCLQCQNPMLSQQDKCVSSCSSGFEPVLNKKTKLTECLLIDRYLNVSFQLFAFHSNEFSGIEAASISGLSPYQFVTQYDLGSIVSKCGNQQLYDFPKNTDSQILITLNNQKQNITLTQSQLSQATDICGFEGLEVFGTFSLYAISNSQNNTLNILNQNSNAYFGVREISIYTFDCLQNNCKNCTLNNLETTCQTCVVGYYLQSNTCIQCNPTCYDCQNSSSCISCLPIQGLTLNKSNQCVCQEYYFFDSVNTVCSACKNQKCLTCQENDSTQCISCKPPLALLATDCVESCGTGMAVNQSSNKCQNCIQNCSNCDNNLLSCNKCQNGFFFLSDQCQQNCPDGYYGDVQNAICIPCSQSECVNCVFSKDICTKCQNNFLVDINSSKCISNCSFNQYADQGYCKNCSQLYQNCASCDITKCTKCIDNFVLSVDQKLCLNQCPIETVQVNQQCIQCKANCNLCDSNLVCQQCSTGFYLYQGQCSQTCLPQYYPDQYNKCQPCSNLFMNCSTCSSKQCLTCDVNSNYKYLDVNQKQCVENCEIGQFLDSKNQCQKCQNIQCATCNQSNSSICLSCDPSNSSGNIFLDQSGNCVKQCLFGFFADLNNVCQDCKQYDTNCILCNSKICLQCKDSFCLQIDNTLQSSCKASNPNCNQNNCPNYCLACQNDICLACSQNFFLLNGQCVRECTGPQYYANYQQQTCDSCSQKFGQDCLECNQNSCIKCNQPNQYIFKSQCKNSCGDGYYVDNNNFCQPCSNNNCLSCNPLNPIQCQTCPNSKSLLQNGDCVSQCSQGYYQNLDQCSACSSNCSICNSSQCLMCKQNYKLDVTQQNCINTACPPGQYQGQNYFGSDACLDCSKLFDNCIECTSNQCQKCNSQKILNSSNNTCIDSCPDNYYAENNVCKQCTNPQCKTCSTSVCNSCFLNGQNPYLNEQGNCVSKCKSTEYLDEKNLKCISCSSKYGSSCLSCNSQACIKCDKNQFISDINNNSCVSTCPSGQYGNTTTNLCQNCENSRCSTCNQQPNLCDKCINQYPYLFQGQCLSQCQEGYFPDQDNNCQSCISKYDINCALCDLKQCNSCSPSSNLFLLNNSCVSTCPDFYYPFQQDIKICKQCQDSNCKQCNISDPSKCLSCSGSYLLNEQCNKICPYGTFPNQIDNTCTYCYSKFSSCQECTEKNCISCLENLFMLEDTQQCVQSCPANYIDSSLINNNPNSNLISNSINKKVCKRCANQNCNTCDPKDTNKCLSCSQSLENSPLIYLYNKDCIQKCDFYVNLATNECFDSCPNYLLQIENPKQCQECPQFIQSKACVKQCTSNTYIDQTHSKLCVVCQDQYDNNCILCNSSKCLKCSQGFYLYQNKCYSQCPENTYFDKENYICLDKCIDPLVLISPKQCSKNCPSGYYKEPINSQNQIICGLCDKKCKECFKKSSFCTVCSQGSGWDCLDKEDFDTFLKNQYCEYLKEESQIEKCSKIVTEKDRFISYINGNQDMGIIKFNCPNSNSVQFKKQFYGNPLGSTDTYNFKFETNIPHFEREVNIDFIFFRGDGDNQITVYLDGVKKNKFEIYYPFQLKELCDSSMKWLKKAYKEFEQILKCNFILFQYNKINSQQKIFFIHKINNQISIQQKKYLQN
ncbi:zinc finger lsd1 subclass family protein (macronuclear) [Tetrahymena thermophila SB210]|uniref:Zinc finger lsd1 subclass family protein n=1 Tax=Tetrahymena thermophila (strain SB210) TaxID=312017 RepID=I7MDQ1_TETTS|nr:zinc finger lsd1 subclass family protein [Tetrahymena thermophila SB210]EAR90732.2 zinc finger lsd1 subclass family protein [Tetrahymena thermophila SB210]|eukprot:XP_001010977.2 zinc finger lsd1 subclass family protein [Tetrahymena thermophila SB210]